MAIWHQFTVCYTVFDIILISKGCNSVEQKALVPGAGHYCFIGGVVNQQISKDLSCDARNSYNLTALFHSTAESECAAINSSCPMWNVLSCSSQCIFSTHEWQLFPFLSKYWCPFLVKNNNIWKKKSDVFFRILELYFFFGNAIKKSGLGPKIRVGQWTVNTQWYFLWPKRNLSYTQHYFQVEWATRLFGLNNPVKLSWWQLLPTFLQSFLLIEICIHDGKKLIRKQPKII